jgi:uncharacterized protein (TIGR03435 family)
MGTAIAVPIPVHRNPLPGKQMTLLQAIAFASILVATPALAQSLPPAVMPSFETASVRPSKPGSVQRSDVPLDAGNIYSTVAADDARTAAGGLLIASHQPLWRYISFAYKLSGTQELALRFNMFSGAPRSGAPFWVTGSFDASPESFDITARAPAETSIEDMRLMMRTLLAERFHLETHMITADTPVFGFVLVTPGVLGPDLHPASQPCNPEAAAAGLPPACGVIAHVVSPGPGLHFGGRAVPLSLFAASAPTMTGLAAMPRPVVDQTGLPGLYDFTLTWTHDDSGADGAMGDNAASFRTALKKQLGLQLKSARAPISFLVIDHVERPSEN